MSLRDLVRGIGVAQISHETLWSFHPPMIMLEIRATVRPPNTVEEVRVFMRFLEAAYTEMLNADIVAREPIEELPINRWTGPQRVVQLRLTVRYVQSRDSSEE